MRVGGEAESVQHLFGRTRLNEDGGRRKAIGPEWIELSGCWSLCMGLVSRLDLFRFLKLLDLSPQAGSLSGEEGRVP